MNVEFTENVKNNIAFLNLNDAYKDELFLTIKRNRELRILLRRVTILLQYLTLFGWLFFIFAIISIFFYTSKTALILFGLTSMIHIVFAPVALFAIRAQNRYLLFSFCLANLIWLASISFSFYYYFFVADSADLSKIQFNKEIVLHVGFAFYYPIAFFTFYYLMKMFDTLIRKVKQNSVVLLSIQQSAPKNLK